MKEEVVFLEFSGPTTTIEGEPAFFQVAIDGPADRRWKKQFTSPITPVAGFAKAIARLQSEGYLLVAMYPFRKELDGKEKVALRLRPFREMTDEQLQRLQAAREHTREFKNICHMVP